MIAYPCPHCGERLTVDESKAGSAYICSLCGQSSVVPGPPGGPPKPTAPTAAPSLMERDLAAMRTAAQPRVYRQAQGIDWLAIILGVLFNGPALLVGLWFWLSNDPDREHRGKTLVAASLGAPALAILVGLVAGLFVGPGADVTSFGPAPAKYVVTGTGPATITYLDEEGETRTVSAVLPWTYGPFEVRPTEVLSVAVRPQQAGQPVTAVINIAGKPWKTATSVGPDGNVTANVWYGMEGEDGE